jgi:hypothetical protein
MCINVTWVQPGHRWPRVLIVLVLAVFCCEFVFPTTIMAQGPPNPSLAQNGDALPPMQKAETIATPPFYKRWWFWTLVAVVVIGGVAVAAAGGGGGNGGQPPSSGAVVTGPALP